MTTSSCSVPRVLLAAIAALACTASAANFTTTTQQVSGDTNHWGANIWGSGTGATAGNTYEVLLGGRVRTPNGTVNSGGNGLVNQTFTFPGDSLTLNGNGFTTVAANVGELRVKSSFNGITYNFPGVGGNAGLVLNGGMLNDGDDRIINISGLVRAVDGKTSSINPGGTAITDISALRGFNFLANLLGDGNLSLDYGHDIGAAVPALQISSSNPSFTGDWIVNSGWLQGAGIDSLGFGNITLFSTLGGSTLDLNYDLFNPTGTLTLNGTGSKILLDQNLTFAAVTINGTPLAPGTHSFATLNASHDANIVDGGTGSITVVPEPASLTTLLLGTLALLTGARRRRPRH